MLPLQITLDGFMSYREPATLSFEGASLWMLAGANGAGKSSVFDAMRWMLFNRHRGGAQGHEALIHHDKTRLRVAFDLEIAAGRFRLLRTLSRGGKSSWQIERLVPGLLGEATEKVPETDMRDGYNRWISENIGLSDETFGAAFYLAQGRGDAILSARPEERYEMLAEIVDLSAYARLHERVKTRAAELKTACDGLSAQFKAAPQVEAEVIAARRAEAELLSRRGDELEARLAEVRRLAPWASQWESLQNGREKLEIEQISLRQLLENSAQIERDAARLAQLQNALPPLEKWLGEGRRAEQNEVQTRQSEAEFRAAETRRDALQIALEQAQNELRHAETERQTEQTAQLTILKRQTQLAPRVARADSLQKARQSEKDLETQLRAFPSDGSEQIAALETQITDAQASQSALAVLRRFGRQRNAWLDATQNLATVAHQQTELESARPELAARFQASAESRDAALQKRAEVLEFLVAAQARAGDASAAQTRFAAVQKAAQNEATCHFCGQILTPEHAALEARRLEEALHHACETQRQAQNALDNADAVLQKIQAEWEADGSRLNSCDGALSELQIRRAALELALKNALEGAAESLGELSPAVAARFDGKASSQFEAARVEAALGAEFPLENDFSAFQSRAEELSGAQKSLEKARKQEKEREKVAARLEAIRAGIEPLQAEFAGQSLEVLAAESADLKSALDATAEALSRIETDLKTAKNRETKAQTALETARRDGAQAHNRLAGFAAARSEIERARQQIRDSFPAFAARFELPLAVLRDEFAREQAELRHLENGDLASQIEALNGARERENQLHQERLRVETALQSVPADARRAVSELDDEIEVRRGEVEAIQAQRREIEVEIAGLERLWNEKTALQKALLEAENAARQHRTLADLLGPHQLQRFLLREAENGIVDEANATLDRISSGTLRLELRADDDEVAGARKGVPKVLDLAVWQDGDSAPDGSAREGQSRAMLPAFLSGSQRFRVAVALALGIGRFATRGQGRARLESVIIDEGFGSLDKIGRAEMIEELRALGDELRRVILVSHQEEFIEAFPNRYLIEHDGVASTARLSVN